MEAEKIKTAEEIYEECIGSNSELGYIPTAKESVIEAINKFASQFKQPPVSVMPSEEIVRTLRTIEQMSDPGDPYKAVYEMKSIASDLIDKILSLSKEANNERIPDVGETIRETAIEFAEWLQNNRWFNFENNLWNYTFESGTSISDKTYRKHYQKTTEELFDLFKQRK